MWVDVGGIGGLCFRDCGRTGRGRTSRSRTGSWGEDSRDLASVAHRGRRGMRQIDELAFRAEEAKGNRHGHERGEDPGEFRIWSWRASGKRTSGQRGEQCREAYGNGDDGIRADERRELPTQDVHGRDPEAFGLAAQRAGDPAVRAEGLQVGHPEERVGEVGAHVLVQAELTHLHRDVAFAGDHRDHRQGEHAKADREPRPTVQRDEDQQRKRIRSRTSTNVGR